jgi:hypothetical protein
MRSGITLMAIAFAAAVAHAEGNKFGPPELLLDASSYLYPSPVLVDIDQDQQRELLIGDLRGYLTVYDNVGKPDSPQWGKPAKLQCNGKDMKLPNW